MTQVIEGGTVRDLDRPPKRRNATAPMASGNQNVISRYVSVISVAAAHSTRKVFRATVMVPSTIPRPEGVGETIRNKYPMAKPPMRVPMVKGVPRAEKCKCEHADKQGEIIERKEKRPDQVSSFPLKSMDAIGDLFGIKMRFLFIQIIPVDEWMQDTVDETGDPGKGVAEPVGRSIAQIQEESHPNGNGQEDGGGGDFAYIQIIPADQDDKRECQDAEESQVIK